MKQFNYKCVVNKNGNKVYYKRVQNKWKRISNKTGQKAEKREKKYKTPQFENNLIKKKFRHSNNQDYILYFIKLKKGAEEFNKEIKISPKNYNIITSILPYLGDYGWLSLIIDDKKENIIGFQYGSYENNEAYESFNKDEAYSTYTEIFDDYKGGKFCKPLVKWTIENIIKDYDFFYMEQDSLTNPIEASVCYLKAGKEIDIQLKANNEGELDIRYCYDTDVINQNTRGIIVSQNPDKMKRFTEFTKNNGLLNCIPIQIIFERKRKNVNIN